MILLDADLLLIDIRYPNDARFSVNRHCLDLLKPEQMEAGITQQALLEVVGVLSFNVSPAHVPRLIQLLPGQYGLQVIPGVDEHTEYAGCQTGEVVDQIRLQMALGDAVQSAQIRKFTPDADCLLSWNARHFVGKSVVPALTPQDWLSQRAASSP